VGGMERLGHLKDQLRLTRITELYDSGGGIEHLFL